MGRCTPRQTQRMRPPDAALITYVMPSHIKLGSYVQKP